MLELLRTNSSNKDFQKLVVYLDRELKVRDGEEHEFFAQFNSIDAIHHVVVAFKDAKPVACGAFKEYSNEEGKIAEIKRMFTDQECRGQGVATHILRELEHWAVEVGFEQCILETGLAQPEAVALYAKNGYQRIPNFGQYTDVQSSVCFSKSLQKNG